MGERIGRQPEIMVPRESFNHPFSDKMLFALAVDQAFQIPPVAAELIGTFLVADGIRGYLLTQLLREPDQIHAKAQLIGRELQALAKPTDRVIPLGPFEMALLAFPDVEKDLFHHRLRVLAAEGTILFIRKLITTNWDRGQQKAFIAGVKGNLAPRGLEFDPEIGVISTLIGLISGYPNVAVENQNQRTQLCHRAGRIIESLWEQFPPKGYIPTLAKSFAGEGGILAYRICLDLNPQLQAPRVSLGGKPIDWQTFFDQQLFIITAEGFGLPPERAWGTLSAFWVFKDRHYVFARFLDEFKRQGQQR
jgi:hypothetical protein